MTLQPIHHCHMPKCKMVVPPNRLFCLSHWRMVPKAIQRRVWDTYRPGQEVAKDPSDEYLEAAAAAITAVEDAEKKRG